MTLNEVIKKVEIDIELYTDLHKKAHKNDLIAMETVMQINDIVVELRNLQEDLSYYDKRDLDNKL